MSAPSLSLNEHTILEREYFQQLLDKLENKGYQVMGPTICEGAIVYHHLTSVSEFPIGYTDEQEGGTYRLKRRGDQALFGYAVGPHSWKRFLHPPMLRFWQARREGNTFQVNPENSESPRYAFVGVRSCELHALAIQDRVFMQDPYTDPAYQARRDQVFIVAVNCGQAGGTCFCVSMQTGPKATSGFDLALTEILDAERHSFLVEVGTEQGAALISELPYRAATEEDEARAAQATGHAAEQMGRVMDTTDIKGLLYRNLEHPRWDAVATRCLTCGNCTMVCPTCFCTSVEDTTDLTGERAERWRRWDSCFTMDFSYIAGSSVRASPKARYRQWMTHKLATWIDQFGTSGCVGCGRCITWCPVGIDITEEVRAIRESDAQPAEASEEER